MYLALYEWDSALTDYNTAIELDPAYADAYYERGVLYYSILQTGVELRTDALADFWHYLDLAPDGDKAADAARYVEQIETELEALNG
jgi:tetratricopeptide (TPR) repeat protein